MLDPTGLRIQVLDSFENMLAALSHFCACVRKDTDFPLWVALTEQEEADNQGQRDKAINLYQSLWYEDGQDGRETITRPGILGASTETLDAALVCNDSKDAFKQAVLALKKLPLSQSTAALDELHTRDEKVAAAMQRMGAARLNLKQAYRHIPLLETRPVKVGFTWSKQGRTIVKTSVNEARRLLERRTETPQTRAELHKLSQVSELETLARVRSVCPHLRANIVFRDADGETERRLMQTPLPLLIPLQVGEPLPEFVPIPAEPVGSVRLRRSDVKIEDEIFLPLLHIHRYRPSYR